MIYVTCNRCQVHNNMNKFCFIFLYTIRSIHSLHICSLFPSIYAPYMQSLCFCLCRCLVKHLYKKSLLTHKLIRMTKCIKQSVCLQLENAESKYPRNKQGKHRICIIWFMPYHHRRSLHPLLHYSSETEAIHFHILTQSQSPRCMLLAFVFPFNICNNDRSLILFNLHFPLYAIDDCDYDYDGYEDSDESKAFEICCCGMKARSIKCNGSTSVYGLYVPRQKQIFIFRIQMA